MIIFSISPVAELRSGRFAFGGDPAVGPPFFCNFCAGLSLHFAKFK
jgi:hypothetical protein